MSYRNDLDALYGAADVVCVPSTRPEPLGLVALEAAAAAKCVVASNTGGLPEIVRENRSSVTVAIGCTGGRHRSVYLAEKLGEAFQGQWNVLVRHRGLARE